MKKSLQCRPGSTGQAAKDLALRIHGEMHSSKPHEERGNKEICSKKEVLSSEVSREEASVSTDSGSSAVSQLQQL